MPNAKRQTPIPARFARNVIDLHGEAGTEWLARLPALLQTCSERWSIRIGEPYAGSSYNLVVRADRSDGTAAALKVGFPSSELGNEIEALRLYDGAGCVRLLEADPEIAAMLLERVEPGAPLSALPGGKGDSARTSIAVNVMRRLRAPLPDSHSFPTVADWGRGFARHRERFGGGPGPLPSDLFREAELLFAELTTSSDPPVLLHGDLHHYNILSAKREQWLAIDPQGVAGEPAYEVGALLRNPDEPDLASLLSRRVDQLAEELGFDRARVRGWGMAQAVLSAIWSIEDHGAGWESAITIAHQLKSTRNRPARQ